MSSSDEDQQKQSDFYTPAGRDTLYRVWIKNYVQHHGDPDLLGDSSQRRALFERWLRDLITRGHLDLERPLPTHAFLAEPFQIHTDQVARVLRRLRKERLLPAKKLRMNAGEPVWTPRDLYVLEWIADQRAVRYDQLRRLLSRESDFLTKDPKMLSMSRTTETIKRWVRVGHAIYQPILAKQPGWIWLTRKGLQTFSEQGYRASGAPAPGTINHLYWINEVRLHLEESDSETIDVWWTSERFFQHQREQLKKKDQEEVHMIDGLVEIEERGTTTSEFEIEVELSRKNDAYLQKLMRGGPDGFTTRALRYYVGKDAETTILTALEKLPGTICYRPWVEVYNLEFKLLGKVAARHE